MILLSIKLIWWPPAVAIPLPLEHNFLFYKIITARSTQAVIKIPLCFTDSYSTITF